MKKMKGITLISLVITIIILIILAGVGISLSMGNNGIFIKAQNSKRRYTQEEIKEKLILKIADIQIEKQENANLSDLDELSLEGYNVSVGAIGRLITVSKNSEDYIYWVDSKLNITEFDGNISIENNNNTTIQEFTPIISNINGTYFTIEANAISSESTVVAYEFFVNNEYKGIILAKDSNKIDITELELDTEYEVYVVALDDKGTVRKSSTERVNTLDKQYLIKDGNVLISMTKANIASVTQNEGYIQVLTSNVTDRAAYYTSSAIDLSDYSNIKIDIEVISKTESTLSALCCSFFSENANPIEDNWFNYIDILRDATSLSKQIVTIDVSQMNEKCMVVLLKNATLVSSQVKYNLYNVWLEK